jgi:hypothetical protein
MSFRATAASQSANVSPRTGLVLLGLGFAFAACGGSHEGRPSTEVPLPANVMANLAECEFVRGNRPPSYEQEDFFGKLTFGTHVSYLHFATIDALADGADRVFIGKMIAVQQGNLYGNTGSSRGGLLCDRNTTHTTNLVFEVERDLRGAGPRHVVVEQFTTRFVFSEELAPFMPRQRMLVFVESVAKSPRKGAASGAYDRPLFYFHSPLGLVTEIDAALAFPLERWGHPTPPLPATTLDELASHLARP